MKKIILLAVVAVAVTSASCRKERTCDCKVTETYSDGSFTETQTSSTKTTTAGQKKKYFKASEHCYNTTTTVSDNGDTYTLDNNCTLN